MLEKIYSVFVSSTYEDLREERAEVQRALLMAKCFPIGMEAFPSTDEETWEFIKRQIEDADFYLLVVAGRYGSIDGRGIGFTEKEYDYAREIKKPIVAFVHSDPGSIAASKTDQDDTKHRSLLAFLTKIQSGPLVSRYTTPHELRANVLLSITNLKETNKTAIGFVRGNQTADLKKYADALEDISRLRSELEISRKREGDAFPEVNEKINLRFNLYSDKNNYAGQSDEYQVTWGALFVGIANNIVTGNDIDNSSIQNIIKELTPPKKSELIARFEDQRLMQTIRAKMFARNLFDFQSVTRHDSVSGSYTKRVWLLTENGKIWYRKLLYDGPPSNDKIQN